MLLRYETEKMGDVYDSEILREAIEKVNEDLEGGQIVLQKGRWVAKLDPIDESSS